MQKLSMKKQLSIIRFYFEGLSYDQIASKANVSKGTVANIISDMKAGNILEVQVPAEQVELLRELAQDLKHFNLTPGQALLGLSALSSLQQMGIEPSEIQKWAAVYHNLIKSEADKEVFTSTALTLDKIHQETGMDYTELEHKVLFLNEEVKKLEPLLKELQISKRNLTKLTKQQNELKNQVAKLQQQRDQLAKDIAKKETHSAELSIQVEMLEQRAHDADIKLASARKELKEIAALGLSPEELSGFIHEITSVAQKQEVKPSHLRNRLISELEALDNGISLESMIDMKKNVVKQIDHEIAKAKNKRATEEQVLHKLQQEQAALKATINNEYSCLENQLNEHIQVTANQMAQLKQGLADSIKESIDEVYILKDHALQLGQEVGRCNEIIEANQWLITLVSLVKGDFNVNSENVRIIALAILRGLSAWLDYNQGNFSSSYLLKMQLGNAIQELERWKPQLAIKN